MINIVFLLATPFFLHLYPLIVEMKKLNIFTIYIVIYINNECSNSLNFTINDIKTILNDYNIEINLNIIDNLRNLLKFYEKTNIHYTFIQSPYENHYRKKLFSKINYLTKIIFIPYGIDNFGGENKIWYNDIVLINSYFYFIDSDKNKNELDIYLKKYNSKCKNIIVGIPKVEYLRKNLYSYDKKKILISFRWTENETTINLYDDYFVDFCKKNNNIDVCYRPHPASHTKYYSSHNYNKLLNFTNDNYKIDKSFNLLQSFSESAFFIIDYSSLMVEFILATKKPVIYLCNKDNDFNEIGKESLEVMYKINNINYLDKIIFDLLNGNDYKKDAREQFADKYYKDNSIENIIKIITEDKNNS